MRIVVAGMAVGDARQGGATWAVLQYVLGLRALGHDVLLVEEVEDARFAGAAGRLRALAERFGLRAGLVGRPSGRMAGLGRGDLDDAELLLNLSGVLRDEDLLARPSRRAYVDLDPAFTQLWAEQGAAMGLDGHERHVTVGMRLGAPDCPVPLGGRHWITTPQPIALAHWPVAHEPAAEALTTVANWRSYGSIHHHGTAYGQKAHALRPLFGLPARTGARFRLALGIHPGEREDLAALAANGWELDDPLAVAGTPADYRAYVRGSWAEFGLAKHGYVASRCGWFSDRSLCYLASGRPVLAHDTGFGDWLPTGEGVLAFADADGVAAGIEALRGDYARHRRAARELAEDVFRAERVLGELLACL
ncbi:MAG: hypothetical protein QOE28_1536 [Solirubrobacteraceae bacterium]|nr:hypothetical protein [Solirubrobacteraceae bacterium]